jgi:hypothetical protein
VFVRELVSVMVTVEFCLNVTAVPLTATSVQLASASVPTEVAGVNENVPDTAVLGETVPEKLNEPEGGVTPAPTVTLQTTIWLLPGARVTAFGLIAAFFALPFLTCFVA